MRFGFSFMRAILSIFEKLMTADGGLITGAGKAYDSGRGGFLCAFLFVVFYSFRVFVVAGAYVLLYADKDRWYPQLIAVRRTLLESR